MSPRRRRIDKPQTIEDAVIYGMCIGPAKESPDRIFDLVTRVIDQRISEALQEAQGHKHTVKILNGLKQKLSQRRIK